MQQQWRRRQWGVWVLSSLVTLGLTRPKPPVFASSLRHPRDFAMILNLQTGKLDIILHPEQADRIRVQPGSLAKVITATTALDQGVTDAQRRIECPGWFDPPASLGIGRLPCWRAHGLLGVTDAIAQSCNTYFYQIGMELGTRRLLTGLHRFGWAQEISHGLAPLLATGEDPQLKVTPWQVGALMAALAKRGAEWPSQDPRIRPRSVRLDGWIWSLVRHGMVEAVRTGTCQGLVTGPERVAAKTGTILNWEQDQQDRLQAEDFQAWLAAFEAREDPEWVLVMFLHQGKAYETAIPVARSILRGSGKLR